MEHIGVIVHAYAVKGLGCRIVTLFKGVHEYVDKRIDHKKHPETGMPAIDRARLSYFVFP